MSRNNLMIVQGGGPTAVFNVSLAAIVEEAQRSERFGRILGARRGTLGLVRGDLADLSTLTADELARLRRTPGAALLSSRHKPSERELASLVETLRKHDVGALIYLGGNGTMRGAHLIGEVCRVAGLDELRVIGVPKTIDNDIAETDRCPGFASAGRYYATSVRELGADLRSLRQPITILETMGRNVGWLAAASILGRVGEEPAPQIIGMPEVPFEFEAFVDTLDGCLRTQGWAVAVVAEGLTGVDGEPVWENRTPSQADAIGRPLCGGVGQYLADRVSSRLGVRCRNEKPGLLGRGSIALASEQDRADATLVGQAGVRAALAGETDVMIALEPLVGGNDLGYRLVPLAAVAEHARLFPRDWIGSGPLPVGEAFVEYAGPLVGALEEHLVRLPPVP
jgi:6-phosphofructokinase 1